MPAPVTHTPVLLLLGLLGRILLGNKPLGKVKEACACDISIAVEKHASVHTVFKEGNCRDCCVTVIGNSVVCECEEDWERPKWREGKWARMSSEKNDISQGPLLCHVGIWGSSEGQFEERLSEFLILRLKSR